MNVEKRRITYILCLFTLFISIASTAKAQDMRGEFKKQLRQSLQNSEMKHSQQIHQPYTIEAQKNQEVLKVSPTTRLPTRLDRFINIDKMKYKEVNINPLVTNAETYKTIPAKTSGADFDPVRAIQNHKARKRKKKVDRIVKAYSMD